MAITDLCLFIFILFFIDEKFQILKSVLNKEKYLSGTFNNVYLDLFRSHILGSLGFIKIEHENN